MMNEPTKVIDKLYIGNEKSFKCKRHFDGIVSVMVNPPSTKVIATDKRNSKRLLIRLQDSADVEIKPYINEITSFIHEITSSGGEVLVHCKMGVSRSCTAVLGYLMEYEKMTLFDSYQLVRSKRPTVRPNDGFWKQLIELEKELFDGKSSVSFITLRNSYSVPSVYEKEFENMIFL